jgi:haloalkane dehalogenase
MKTAPPWVDRSIYPFQSKWIKLGETELHYVDEGRGDVILFVHGTPEWSFAYRRVIQLLRAKYRCVALDLLGFGLSDKPPGEDYTCNGHAVRLRQFVEQLGIRQPTFVANDFGGGIALHYAVHHPDNVRAIVLSNTWCWSLRNDPHYARPIKIARSLFGRFLYLQMNFPVTVLMPSAYGDRRLLTRDTHRHYKRALPDAASRLSAYRFARELMDASPWWEDIRSRFSVLDQTPVLLLWGLGDKFIPPYELGKWQTAFRNATTRTFETAGHFIHEEKPEAMAQEIEKFLSPISSTR